jgi:hypothetical protein
MTRYRLDAIPRLLKTIEKKKDVAMIEGVELARQENHHMLVLGMLQFKMQGGRSYIESTER